MYKKENRNKWQEARIENGHVIFFLLVFFFSSLVSNAQCAMCRAALESQGDTNKAEAVNDGIVYLMVIPYILVGVIGYAIYRTRKGKKQKA